MSHLVLTVKEIAERVRGELVGDGDVEIRGVNSLGEACQGDISFFADRRYAKELGKTRASALLVAAVSDLYHGPQIVVGNPLLAYAHVAQLFTPPLPRFRGISPEAVIGEGTKIGTDVSIYPFVYVGDGAEIGDGATLFPGVFVGEKVKIGSKTVLQPNVTVMPDSVIGDEVIIHPGCVIGSDGFGFVRDGATNVKIPQLGFVQIEDRVEIGANSCIDRAASGKTLIKKAVKTDNLVQIAHNAVIGEDTVVVAQTAIGGSAHIGKGVIIGGQSAISDHVRVEDRAMIGSKTGVPKPIAGGEVVSGIPAMPHRLWLKTRHLITRLPQLNDRIRGLERKLEELEARLKQD
jgi:UDP-3-O-[3-hydroxymyristoyl] glucosamine N-acyltransferase